ncbi:hypothetical protein GCM10020255_044070 [Rhodococcus baikonurensis]
MQEDGDGFDAEEVEDVGGAVDRFDLVAELQIGDPAGRDDLRRVGGEIAMTPSGMPSTMFTVKGSVAGVPLVYVMFAAIRGSWRRRRTG